MRIVLHFTSLVCMNMNNVACDENGSLILCVLSAQPYFNHDSVYARFRRRAKPPTTANAVHPVSTAYPIAPA